MYPKRIRHKNATLVPFAVLALYAFITFIGQDAPKLNTINISNNSAILFSPNKIITELLLYTIFAIL